MAVYQTYSTEFCVLSTENRVALNMAPPKGWVVESVENDARKAIVFFARKSKPKAAKAKGA